MNLFWDKGYDATSLADLTEAIGINRPSLYAAFGDKEALFMAALDRYAAQCANYPDTALEEPTAFEVFEALLMGALDNCTRPGTPPGCLMVNSALLGGENTEAIRRALVSRREGTLSELEQRYRRAQREGDLPSDADPAQLAIYTFAVIDGIAVQAARSASRDDLLPIVDAALRSWAANGGSA